MKTLTLLRHAKSSWGDPSRSDFERPLNTRGHQAARAMGHHMRALELAFDRVVASPAARVVETLGGLAETFGPIAPDYDERIYLAPAEVLLDIVRATDDACRSLLIVGHNPGMERLAFLLSEAGELRAAVAAKYPTGALVEIALPAERWRDVREHAGAVGRFIRPRDLEPPG